MNETFKKFEFVFINSYLNISKADLIEEKRKYQIKSRIVMDPTQALTKELGFKVSGESAFVVWGKGHSFNKLYQGAVDNRNSYEYSLKKAPRKYLENAISNYLNRKPIDPNATHPRDVS